MSFSSLSLFPFFRLRACRYGDGVPAIRFLIKIVEIVLTYQDIYVNILLRSGTTAVVFMVFFHWVTGVPPMS